MARNLQCAVRILISAGEASGEMYGAELILALRRRDATLQCFGAGGPAMRAAGCDIVVDAKDLSVVGISEILSHLPKIYALFRKLIRQADERRPDLAVIIDSPAFNWRVARQMRKRGIPVVYYVCPQFWAWRQGRVRLLRKYVNKALVIFPFEEEFYRGHGVDATFVGHPLAEICRPPVERGVYAEQYKLDAAKFWITLMPGSRTSEVRMNLPAMLESAAKLGPNYQFLLPAAPTLDPAFLRSRIASPAVHIVAEALPALALSRAGIIASGTATVEAAMMGTPFVAVYRVSRVTYLLGRSLVKVPHFAMVNLIAAKKVVPEFIQQDFTATNVVNAMQQIIPDGLAREEMLNGFSEVKARLRGPEASASHPAGRAAGEIMNILSLSRPT